MMQDIIITAMTIITIVYFIEFIINITKGR